MLNRFLVRIAGVLMLGFEILLASTLLFAFCATSILGAFNATTIYDWIYAVVIGVVLPQHRSLSNIIAAIHRDHRDLKSAW
jgi:hypothetical protein